MNTCHNNPEKLITRKKTNILHAATYYSHIFHLTAAKISKIIIEVKTV